MYTIVLTATDPSGASDSITITVNVEDVDDPPVVQEEKAPVFDADTAEFSVDENSAAGTVVGSVTATDDNGDDDPRTYSLSGDDASSFAIDEDTGQISVGADAMLDYESDTTSYSVTVTATDRVGYTDTIDVTITVTGRERGADVRRRYG